MAYNVDEKNASTSGSASQPALPARSTEDPMPSTSDFVKKLYKMLEDPSFQSVVCWGPLGDCFVVKDMNEFTKSILPRMFKHSNFASFVRQLNKYDFHKVKNTDDNQFGEHSWTFRHPDFHADRRDALENIKRKVPAARKYTPSSSSNAGPSAIAPAPASPSPTHAQLTAEIQRLKDEGDDLRGRIRNLERNYENVLVELVGFQRGMAQQDGLMQSLIGWFLEGGDIGSGIYPPIQPSSLSEPGLFLPPQAVQQRIGQSPADIGRATLMQMNELSRRGMSAGESGRLWSGMDFNVGGNGFDAGASAGPSQEGAQPRSRAEQLAQIRDYYNQRQAAGSSSTSASVAAAASTQRRSSDSVALAASRAMAEAQVQQQQQSPASVSSYSTDQPTPPQWGPTPPFVDASSSSSFSPQSQGGVGMGQYPSPSDNDLMTHEGLQVYTVGHLLPRNTYVEDAQGNWSFDPSALLSGGMLGGLRMGGQDDEEEEVVRPSPSIPIGIPSSSSTSAHQSPELLTASTPGVKSGGTSGATQQKLRVRRSTFVPGWAVPPRVLLVDDDAVSRKLSSKFLKVFGCTTDVAVDGIGAVNKMNLEKYDLVLMDIVMPKLDGVSATSLIRKFDQGTPIISMTSNSKPNEIMTYYSSGMNDILPKPFTKEGLLDMLEKHLMHLKVIQQMSRLSRNIGIPPLSDANFEQALTQAYNAPSPFSFQFFGDGDNDGMSMNPLAGMGLTDEQYSTILQNIVNGEGFSGMMDSGIGGMEGGEKRGRMDDMDDDRGGKRSRFEVVE
ncbi:hypothetical protein BDN70DRAFT_802521 [Pholiota conissans]|uniref:Transcription factor n=1 Tax=Pholiota conissans TaxID=109636 RepID=A0A9P5Z6J6_9AGAR|nr:hypothetical protein BDN70DRAFT_802521 [Pholiota conissans]